MVGVCESNIIFPCVRRRAICLSRYLLINYSAEVNQTCYITSPHGNGVQEQHFFLCIPCPSICLSCYLLLQPLGWFNQTCCWPWWLSWMRRPTGDQEVTGSTSAEVGNIPSWRLIMKYFLRSFSSFRWFKKGSCQFLAKEWALYWLTA